MGRISKEKEAEIFYTYAEALKMGAEGFGDTIKFVTTEGLWVGLGIDFFLATGEVHSDNEILFAQREAMVKMFELLDKLATSEIPILKDVNPFGLINDFIQPLGRALSIKIDEGKPTKKAVPITAKIEVPYNPFLGVIGNLLLDGKYEVEYPTGASKIVFQRPYYYPAMPLPLRITISLMMPGILRLIFGFFSTQLTGGSAFSKLL